MDSDLSELEHQRYSWNTPVIGIGVASGGLSALQHFFRHMPADAQMVFVILPIITEDIDGIEQALHAATTLPIMRLETAAVLRPDTIYLLAPTLHVDIHDDQVHVKHIQDNQHHAPIDLFFRALAAAYGRYTAAIILSGTTMDGKMGLQRVKETGGVVLVQDPGEAQYDIMPRSAISSGLVDFVLPVAAMPTTLLSYWHTPVNLQPTSIEQAESKEQAALIREIFTILRLRTGHDFSHYKKATIFRRLTRRMQVHGVTELIDYLQIVRTRAEEVEALLNDLLISVTNFFRDQESWEALEDSIPHLFENKTAEDHIRVWVVACATGEEAYTIAMMLYEYAQTLAHPPSIQVFATDIDKAAINAARQGLYNTTIAADVAPERLKQFFSYEHGQYRIRKEIRDLVLFALHNVLHDPPFSKLDLITCRNLLIYLNRDIQIQILQLFHFILRPTGYLLLGNSESTDSMPGLFATIDKVQRLFQKRIVPNNPSMSMPSLPLAVPLRKQATPPQLPDQSTRAWSELHEELLIHYTPPSVIVNEHYEIVHLSHGAGRFLQFADGEPSHNVLKVVHPDLRLELRTALFTVNQRGSGIETRRVRINLEDTTASVYLLVRFIEQPHWAQGCMMIIFNPITDEYHEEQQGNVLDIPVVDQLEEELQRTKEQLRTTIEQYETAVEEYKAANEELQAINEELRAATEELETSKEELQSVNEELTTVNLELKHKVEEVGQSNNDLQNLMASTDIGTIFVDRELRIKRYTPSAQRIFNLIPSDINRPLSHVTHNLEYEHLLKDAAEVLKSLAIVTREIKSAADQWYLARSSPYRTLEDKIDGVVLTFVDITERKQAELALRENERRLSTILQQMPAGVVIIDRNESVSFVNQSAETILGATAQHIQTLDPYRIWQIAPLEAAAYTAENHPIKQTLQTGISIHGLEVAWHYEIHNPHILRMNMVPLRDSEGQINAGVITFEDITHQKQAQQALAQSEERLRLALQVPGTCVWDWEVQQQQVYLSGDVFFVPTDTFTYALPDQHFFDLIHPDDCQRVMQELTAALKSGEKFISEYRMVLADQTLLWVMARGSVYHQPQLRMTGITQDITPIKTAEARVREARDQLEQQVTYRTQALTQTIAMLQQEVAERERTETALRNSHNQINTILESIHDAFYAVNQDWQFTYVNQQAERLWHRSRATLLGHPIWQAFPELVDQPDYVNHIQAMQQHEVVKYETFSVILGVWIEASIYPTDGGLSVYFRNIQERKEHELARKEILRQLMIAQEEERRRIARELHDQFGQQLTALLLGLKRLETQIQDYPEVQKQLLTLKQIANTIGQEAHRLAMDLRPTVLDDFGLPAALQTLVEQWSEQTGISVEIHTQTVEHKRLPMQLELTLYRVVQEALTNIFKHAQATNVSVVVSRHNNHVAAVIEDNGQGFDSDSVNGVLLPQKHLGLRGMQERVALNGGILTIESDPHNGTTLYVRLPLNEEAV